MREDGRIRRRRRRRKECGRAERGALGTLKIDTLLSRPTRLTPATSSPSTGHSDLGRFTFPAQFYIQFMRQYAAQYSSQKTHPAYPFHFTLRSMVVAPTAATHDQKVLPSLPELPPNQLRGRFRIHSSLPPIDHALVFLLIAVASPDPGQRSRHGHKIHHPGHPRLAVVVRMCRNFFQSNVRLITANNHPSTTAPHHNAHRPGPLSRHHRSTFGTHRLEFVN